MAAWNGEAGGLDLWVGRARRFSCSLCSMATTRKGTVIYDSEQGHVCTCTEAVEYDDAGEPVRPSYLPTVAADRDTEPTESGSWFYVCSRCGAGAWSGC